MCYHKEKLCIERKYLLKGIVAPNFILKSKNTSVLCCKLCVKTFCTVKKFTQTSKILRKANESFPFFAVVFTARFPQSQEFPNILEPAEICTYPR